MRISDWSSDVCSSDLLGDGTGAGKGRQVAAIILDQWLRGRRKHTSISKTETPPEDARRDWTAVGGLALDIQHLNQWSLGSAVCAAEVELGRVACRDGVCQYA